MPYTPTPHSFHLGPLGRLQAIKAPDEGYAAVPDLAVVTHKLLSGNVRTGRPVVTPRTYALSWPYLSDAEKAWLEQCALGYVPGDLYWLDPLVVNQLPLNVSTLPDLAAFTLVGGSGTVSLVANAAAPGSGLAASWVTSAGAAYKYFGPTVRLPVVPGLTFTASVKATAADLSLQMEVLFYNSAGAYISSLFGSNPLFLGTGATLAATGIVPAGAVTAQARPRTQTASVTISLHSWQAQFGPLTAFATGPGMAKVSILSYEPDVYLAGMTNVQMQMVEASDYSASSSGGLDGGTP